MNFPAEFFQDEVREGFFVSSLMKRCFAAEVELVSDIACVCQKHNIKYFAAWGTLLGAWRHQGFVPWDDDLDICMLRPDYERFLQVAPRELSQWYEITSPRDMSGTFLNNVTGIHSGRHIRKDAAYLNKFHGYPYVVSVDVFVYDYAAPTKEEDLAQIKDYTVLQNLAYDYGQMKEAEKLDTVRKVEEHFGIRLDLTKPVVNQLLCLADQVASRYQKGEYITSMWHHANRWTKREEDFRFPAHCFMEQDFLPFEGMPLAVPKDYETVLRTQYPSPHIPVRRKGAHNYPGYQNQEALWKKIGNTLPYQRYQFDKTQLPIKKDRPGTVKQLAAGLLDMLSGVHQGLPALIKEQPAEAVYLLEDVQDAVISIGTNIETLYGEGHLAVACLEEYCEALYFLHEALLDAIESGNAASVVTSHAVLQRQLHHTAAGLHTHLIHRREVVFLPLFAHHWDTLAPLYQAAKADPTCDVYVLPLLYNKMKLDGTLSEEGLISDVAKFPPEVNAISYTDFPWEAHSLEYVIIQDPYDEDSLDYRVDPRFMSGELAAMAGQLIYVDPFRMQDVVPEDAIGHKSIELLTNTPGVAHADLVLVQSDIQRQAYITNLTRWAGEETRPIWEAKIKAYTDMPKTEEA